MIMEGEMETNTCSGLAYDPKTQDWTNPVVFEGAKNRMEAINWTLFNRSWLKDLRIDGKPVGRSL
jgi:hypothetical protein